MPTTTKRKSTKASASTSSFSLEAVKAKTLGDEVKAKLVKRAEEDDNDEDEDEDEDEVDVEEDGGAEEDDGEGQWDDVNEDEDEDSEDEEGEAPADHARLHEKATKDINNTVALERIRDSIKLDPSLPWTETLVVSYPETIDVDVNDDLNRELAFYKQALHGANAARALAAKHKFPFTRPADYFAEMVKSDAHMERIRQRLLDESAAIKRSEEKRKEREGKKFGKQVQMEKLKEREKGKKEMEERLKGLKRKRKDALDGPQDDEAFDVAVEDAIADRPSKRSKGGPGSDKKSKLPRQARDKKFGFGSVGRRSKQNTKESTDNFEPRRGGGKPPARGGKAKGRGGAQRPGKSRRMAARGRR